MPHKRDGPAAGNDRAEAIETNRSDLLPLFDCQRKPAPQSPTFPRVELQQTPNKSPVTIVVDGTAVATNARARPLFALTFRALPGVDGIKALQRVLKYALRVAGLQAGDARELQERR